MAAVTPAAGWGPLVPPLAGRTARVLLAGFVVLHVVLALTAVPHPGWPSVASLVVTCAAAAAAVLAPGLPRGTALAAAVTCGLAVGPLVLPLPRAGWPGYSAWPLGAWTFIALALTLRGRFRTAWLVMTEMAVICIAWSVAAGAGPLPGVDLVMRQAGTLVIGSLFALALRRAAVRIAALEEAERGQVLLRARARAGDEERRAAAGAVLAVAGPSLARIAADGAATADASALLALEGRLRDGIMARPLLTDELVAAASAARSRGDDVVLLIDEALEGVADGHLADAAAFLADRLRRSRGGFTGRAVLHAGVLRVSAHSGGATEVRELRLPAADGG